MESWIVGAVFVLVFVLVLYRKIPIQYVSLGGAAVLLLSGVVPFRVALGNSIEWEVLFIYFGYGMLSVLLQESMLPRALADAIIPKVKSENQLIFLLSAVAAFLSSFMPNPVVVLMIAPLALDVAERLNKSPFSYLVSIAIASNVVTTVTMVADPPSIILAMTTKMSFVDFYWFMGRPGLGTLSVVGVIVALSSLLFLNRKLNAPLRVEVESYKAPTGSVILFLASALAGTAALLLKGYVSPLLIIGGIGVMSVAVLIMDKTIAFRFQNPAPSFQLGPAAVFLLSIFALVLAPQDPPPGFAGTISWQGWIGLGLGLICVATMGRKASKELREYDWDTTLFLMGIFIVIDSVENVGILSHFVNWMMGLGFRDPFWVFMLVTWVSVALSAFIDNVPYTVLMIPVCGHFAKTLGINPHYLYYGMLVGTGIGGNITPVGATANVLACGMLEKRGIKIDTLRFMKLSVPFSLSAVLAAQVLIYIFWHR